MGGSATQPPGNHCLRLGTHGMTEPKQGSIKGTMAMSGVYHNNFSLFVELPFVSADYYSYELLQLLKINPN